MILGCIREVNTDYKERDFVDEVTLENSQACAEHCAKRSALQLKVDSSGHSSPRPRPAM